MMGTVMCSRRGKEGCVSKRSAGHLDPNSVSSSESAEKGCRGREDEELASTTRMDGYILRQVLYGLRR